MCFQAALLSGSSETIPLKEFCKPGENSHSALSHLRVEGAAPSLVDGFEEEGGH